MSNNKQSSVEWFAQKLYETLEIKGDGYVIDSLLDLAKAMHKEEHGKTWDDSLDRLDARGGVSSRAWVDFDDYYAEKFRVNDEQSMIDYNAMEEESEMDNYKEMEDEHKPETATEWLREEITYDNGDGQRWGSFKENIDLTEYFEKAKEMELVGKETSYALGYSEGYNRSLEMIEWYIKNHIKGIE